MPYICVQALADHAPLPNTSDIDWKTLLTPEVVNRAMKRSEFCVRRSRLRRVQAAADAKQASAAGAAAASGGSAAVPSPVPSKAPTVPAVAPAGSSPFWGDHPGPLIDLEPVFTTQGRLRP